MGRARATLGGPPVSRARRGVHSVWTPKKEAIRATGWGAHGAHEAHTGARRAPKVGHTGHTGIGDTGVRVPLGWLSNPSRKVVTKRDPAVGSAGKCSILQHWPRPAPRLLAFAGVPAAVSISAKPAND